MESNNEIARVPFAVNEQDFERETDFIHTKVLSGMKTVTQVHLTVIAFHDNTFLYVPRTAFSDEGQRTAFEAFLKEKCAEYSNK